MLFHCNTLYPNIPLHYVLCYTFYSGIMLYSFIVIPYIQIYPVHYVLCYTFYSRIMLCSLNVNVCVYSLKSPLSSADFTVYALGIGTLSYTVSSPLGRIQHLRTLLQLKPIITIWLSHSTRYPSLLGGQRRRDMKGLPNTSRHDWSCATTV